MATVENSMDVPQKIKNRITAWSRNSTSGIHPKKTKTLIWKDTCTPMLKAALFIIAKIWKQPKFPLIDVYVCAHTHTHNGLLFRYKKE